MNMTHHQTASTGFIELFLIPKGPRPCRVLQVTFMTTSAQMFRFFTAKPLFVELGYGETEGGDPCRLK